MFCTKRKFTVYNYVSAKCPKLSGCSKFVRNEIKSHGPKITDCKPLPNFFFSGNVVILSKSCRRNKDLVLLLLIFCTL